MSGGYFNYEEGKVRNTFNEVWEDAELNQLFCDLFGENIWEDHSISTTFGVRNTIDAGGLVEVLDFYLSGDIDEEDYRVQVKEFKNKWLRRSAKDTTDFYKEKLQEYCDKLKKDFD